jgi:phospholipase C
MSTNRSPISLALTGVCALVLVAAGMQLGSLGASASGFTGRARTRIKHVVIILKENRSFDHYFGSFPGANGATTGETHDGTIVPLVPPTEPFPHDIGHSTTDWTTAYNGGAMNGFDLEANAEGAGGELLPYTSVTEDQIPNYWAYARRYGLGDDMFADFKGASFGNNLFEATAQAGRYDPNTGFRSAITIPSSLTLPNANRWGCDDPPDALVQMQAADGSRVNMYPCFQFQALANTLSRYGVTWRFYADPNGAFEHVALDAISSVRYRPSLWQNVVPLEQFNTDALAGTLPSVSFIVTNATEHPPGTACNGENESTADINDLMNGPDWSSTALFIVWDEWGGFYDHVPPLQVDDISYGFRVPLLVISPWVKYGQSSDGGYISHTFYSHASFIKYVETNWSLPALNPRDAGANDFSDFFDFTQAPKGSLILPQHTCPSLSPEQQRLLETEDPD